MRGTWTTFVAIAALATLGACGGGDDDATNDTTAEPAAAESDTDANSDAEPVDVEETPAEEPDDDGGNLPGGISEGGAASLTLANGESFEFTLWCVLEPQESAGSEILFTLGSRDTPGLDVTQFGSEGTITDIAVASVFGDGFDMLWEASSTNEAFGGGFELTRDGSTITGTGTFYEGGDPVQGEPVDGELVANC